MNESSPGDLQEMLAQLGDDPGFGGLLLEGLKVGEVGVVLLLVGASSELELAKFPGNPLVEDTFGLE